MYTSPKEDYNVESSIYFQSLETSFSQRRKSRHYKTKNILNWKPNDQGIKQKLIRNKQYLLYYLFFQSYIINIFFENF